MHIPTNLQHFLICMVKGPLAFHIQAGHEANQTDVRYELWRRVKDDVFERWEEQTCSLNPAKPAEPVTIEAEGAAPVQGLRHRLQVESHAPHHHTPLHPETHL